MNFLACWSVMCGGSVGVSGSVIASTTTGRSLDSARSQASASCSGFLHADAAQADRLGEGRVGEVRQVLAGDEPDVAHHDPLLPRHLVQVAVVQHQRDPARVGPLLPILGDGDAGVEPVHLHGAVAGDGDAHAIGEAELGADGVRHRRAHRREVPAAAGHHAAADLQVAGVPVGGGAAVGGDDAVVGQPGAQFPEDPLGIQQVVVAVGVARAPRPPSTSRVTLSMICSCQARSALRLSSGSKACSVCLASPLRLTSIG